MNLARRVPQQVGPAHDVGDALKGIVHHHRQLIGKQPVGPLDDKIAHFARQILLQVAVNAVVEVGAHIRHAHPPGPADLSCRQAIAAGAGVDDLAFIVARRLRELAAGAGTGKDRALRLQRIQRGGIGLVALRLNQHLAVPMQAIRLQLAQDRVGRAGLATRAVEIFHPHQPLPAGGAGVEPARQRGDKRAEVQRASGGRGKAPDIGWRTHPAIMPRQPDAALTGRCRAAP